MNRTRIALAVGGIVALLLATAGAQTPTVQVSAGAPGPKVSPTLYGLMTEEINYSYDGGLYGELIQNRTFQDTPPAPGRGNRTGRGAQGAAATAPAANAAPATPPAPVSPPANVIPHWAVVRSQGSTGSIIKDTDQPLNAALKTSLRLEIASVAPGGQVGIANDGFWGIPVRPNTTYRVSFYARASGTFSGPLTIALESNDRQTVLAREQIGGISADWKQYTVKLTTGKDITPSATNRFVITAGSTGTVWFNLVSLFPPTFNDRPNGNRTDIMQLLVDMKPTFLRFPGGNYLEGRDIDNYFKWKLTLGDLSQRPGHLSPWNYRSSDGMGLMEFLNWIEDMHAQPVLAVFAGFTLNGQAVPADKLKPYVDEALDEIEYVMGDKSTTWGAKRAADGHPEPFKLTYVEIGNEDNLRGNDPTYEQYRFGAFYDAIKAKYPQLQIISTYKSIKHKTDLIDEHYYYNGAAALTAALRNSHRYDTYDRNGPKIFVGEWATRIGQPTTNLEAAVGDAAFMTGMERNSDIVVISSYAPLFVNANPGGMQWPSNLIGYDAMNSFGSPSYYAQKMFSTYLGDTILPAKIDNVPQSSLAGRNGAQDKLDQLWCSATKDTAKGMIYLKLVNVATTPQTVQINLNGAGKVGDKAEYCLLTSANPADTNTITDRTKVVPVTSTIDGVSSSFMRTLPPTSVNVFAITGG